MKKQTKSETKTQKTKITGPLDFKKRRELISKSISVEVDLENREIFFQKDLSEKMQFDFSSTNVDKIITTYLNPKDGKKVIKSLDSAKTGVEKPIPFHFVHPITSKAFHFEYRYQIIYVKYSSTRLKGNLVCVESPKKKALIASKKKLK